MVELNLSWRCGEGQLPYGLGAPVLMSPKVEGESESLRESFSAPRPGKRQRQLGQLIWGDRNTPKDRRNVWLRKVAVGGVRFGTRGKNVSKRISVLSGSPVT